MKLPVDLVEVDNEASLDLLCALFKHCECHENCFDYTVGYLASFQIAIYIPVRECLDFCIGVLIRLQPTLELFITCSMEEQTYRLG